MPRTPTSVDTVRSITWPDGSSCRLGLWQADEPSRPVLVVAPAMGAAVAYYRLFFNRLHRAGFSVVAMDWRGHGRNEPPISRRTQFGYSQLVQDLRSVGQWSRDCFPRAPQFLLGHSLGEQLALLTLGAYPDIAHGAILIAAGSVYYRTYPRPWRTLVGTQFAAGLATAWGVWPGERWGFAGTEAAGVMRDWARQARTGVYHPTDAPVDFEQGLRRIDQPVLAMSIDRDPLAQAAAVEHLCAKMPGAVVTHWQSTGGALNHFNWVRHCQPFVDQTAHWLNQLTGATTP